MRYSFIIPVYNRPEEVDELLNSLTRQTNKNFEVLIVEDGSSVPCKEVVDNYADRLKSELLVGMESAILVEAGFKDEVDFLVMVYAPLEVRVERAVKRDCSSRELVMKRIEAQMSDEVKRSHADFVIVNDDETPLIPQVLELISLLSKNNHYLCSAKNN